MRKILILFLALLMCLPLVACGKESKPEEIVMFPSAGRSIAAGAGAVFTSSDDKIATVDDSGLVIAIAPGKATVTVKEKSKTTTYPVTVLDPSIYISLYDISKITLKNEDILQKVQDTMDALLLENATWLVSNDVAVQGDRMTISYTAAVDGQTVAQLGSSDEVFRLGYGNYVQGFEGALFGKKKGDFLRLELTMPTDYTSYPSLAGKPVTFDVTVKKVEKPTFPAFDNDFVQKHTKYQNINEFDSEEYKNAKATLAIAAMVEKSTLLTDPPKALYNHYFNQYVKRLETVLYYEYGQRVSGLSAILKLLEMSEEELRNSATDEMAASVMQDCVFHSFVYQNKLTLTEEDFAKGTAVYISENNYENLDDLLATSGLSLADIREVVLIDFLALKASDMITVIK